MRFVIRACMLIQAQVRARGRVHVHVRVREMLAIFLAGVSGAHPKS